MAALQDFVSDQAPPGATTTQVGTNGLPQWYQDYIQGTAGKAVDIGNQMLQAPIPQQSTAGFNQDQINAFQGVNNNQGSWKPAVDAAGGVLGQSVGKSGTAFDTAGNTFGGIGEGIGTNFGAANSALSGVMGNVNGRLATAGSTLSGVMDPTKKLVNQAQTAVAGNAEQFPDNFSQYMSPYTMSVVNEIGRLGNQNFSEKIMPQIMSSMISSGQFGSERNADVLGRAARDAQLGITGEQSKALESGYGTAGNLFNADANRTQQQQKMQGDTALQGASTVANAGIGVGNAQGALAQTAGSTGAAVGNAMVNSATGQAGALTALGNAQTNLGASIGNTGINQAGALTALGKNTSELGYTDAGALNTVGNQQQALQQTGLDTAYNNEVNAQTHDLNTINNVNNVVRNLQLPTNATQITNAPVAGAGVTASPITTAGQGINTVLKP